MTKSKILGAALVLAGFAFAEDAAAPEPEVTNVTMAQDDARKVTIGYTLAHAPAVVTIDVQTNATDGTWASIGGENIQRVAGDVNKVVEGDGAHAITWMPHLSWPGHKITDNGARVVVTAWALDDTPDYMVVDLASDSTARLAYYPDAGQLPGGILSNKAYRTTHMVLRRIPAANVTWTMGSVGEPSREKDEAPHAVTLDRDYYLAVFPTTQAQWDYLVPTNRAAKSTRGPLRPMNGVSYNDVRNSSIEKYNSNNNDSYGYPKGPHASSYIGRLRKLSGLADLGFDLPSEAQWEFAARAGNGDGFWGDGTVIRVDSANDDFEGVPGNIRNKDGVIDCGSFPPNAWGLYDTVGNTFEWCLDFYETDNTALAGAVNANGETTATGNTTALRVRRSMSYSDTYAWHRSRIAHRAKPIEQNDRSVANGFRLMCYGTLR